jgi:hypothetical protein
MPDVSGEAILEEVDHPHTYPVLRSFLSKCAGVLMLVDAARLIDGDKDQDYFAMKILTYLCEMDSHPKTGWPSRPVGIIFTKADQCEECFEDALQFAQKHAPGLWQHCQQRLPKHRIFATGVAGACAGQKGLGGLRQVPLRIEPRGIVAPFRWLVEQLKP